MAHHAGSSAGIWRWAGTFPRADGGYIVRSEANRYDTVRQLVDSQHRYEAETFQSALRLLIAGGVEPAGLRDGLALVEAAIPTLP